MVGLPARFASNAGDDETRRRVALARWITTPRNPLIWRSIVNRVWHWHFGRGLVATPNDFGRMGSLPSHPDLLDWLAATFRDSGGSLKTLHRLIVTSAVYRQSARHDSAIAAVDGDNQWLWRQNRRRLDAESVHDAILAASGRLDPAMGGPSVQQFSLSSRRARDPGRRLHARTTGTAPAPAGAAFIGFCSGRCPIRSSMRSMVPTPRSSTAVRNESTTPLQALELLNHPFVLRQCGAFAERLARTAPQLDQQVAAGFELAYGRPPATDELDAAVGLRARHGLANVCRLIINSNEFLYVN